MGYSFRLAARVLLYKSFHRQDNTYHGLFYYSRGALAGTRNVLVWDESPLQESTPILGINIHWRDQPYWRDQHPLEGSIPTVGINQSPLEGSTPLEGSIPTVRINQSPLEGSTPLEESTPIVWINPHWRNQRPLDESTPIGGINSHWRNQFPLEGSTHIGGINSN